MTARPFRERHLKPPEQGCQSPKCGKGKPVPVLMSGLEQADRKVVCRECVFCRPTDLPSPDIQCERQAKRKLWTRHQRNGHTPAAPSGKLNYKLLITRQESFVATSNLSAIGCGECRFAKHVSAEPGSA